MLEYQNLVRECQIYKCFALLLGISAGVFIFAFALDGFTRLITWAGALLGAVVVGTAMYTQFESLLTEYPGISDLKEPMSWYFYNALLCFILVVLFCFPEISLTAKAIATGFCFSVISNQPLRKIEREIKQSARR